MFAQGIDEQIIKEKTGHRSDAVQAYKRTEESLLRSAEIAAVGQVEGEKYQSDFDFDIDMLDEKKLLTPLVEYKTSSESTSSCHKKNCCAIKDEHGNCPKICELLKTIDSKKSSKHLSVSLKLKRK